VITRSPLCDVSLAEQLAEEHYNFWNLVATHGALGHFDDLRRARMTIAEKALEGDLHSALRAKDASRLRAAYTAGADFIAGVLQLSAGEIFSCITMACTLKVNQKPVRLCAMQ
jgi:hypothetical protein